MLHIVFSAYTQLSWFLVVCVGGAKVKRVPGRALAAALSESREEEDDWCLVGCVLVWFLVFVLDREGT